MAQCHPSSQAFSHPLPLTWPIVPPRLEQHILAFHSIVMDNCTRDNSPRPDPPGSSDFVFRYIDANLMVVWEQFLHWPIPHLINLPLINIAYHALQFPIFWPILHLLNLFPNNTVYHLFSPPICPHGPSTTISNISTRAMMVLPSPPLLVHQ